MNISICVDTFVAYINIEYLILHNAYKEKYNVDFIVGNKQLQLDHIRLAQLIDIAHNEGLTSEIFTCKTETKFMLKRNNT